jgi:hypothetical protein
LRVRGRGDTIRTTRVKGWHSVYSVTLELFLLLEPWRMITSNLSSFLSKLSSFFSSRNLISFSSGLLSLTYSNVSPPPGLSKMLSRVRTQSTNTEWQWPLSGVLSIMTGKLAHAGEGEGCTISNITYKVVVLQQRGHIHSTYFFTTPIYNVLCGYRKDLQGVEEN